MSSLRPIPTRLPALPTVLSPARVATLTSLAMLSAGARRHAVTAAALTLPACSRSCPDDARCAHCPFARPPSQ